MLNSKKFLISASISLCSSLALAAPVTYFDQDTSPGSTVPVGSLSKIARDSFLGKFDGTVSSFGFERNALVDGDTAAIIGNINFTGSSGTIRARLAGDGAIRVQPQLGRFNTTSPGSKYWEVGEGNGVASFSISFNTGIAGFGFYATDVSDFGSTLKLILTSATSGNPDVELLISPTPYNDGNLIFFGFTDSSDTYTKITFQTVGGGTAPDYFGFDEFVIGDSQQLRSAAVPEPGSLFLASMALFGLAVTSRRALIERS